MGKQSLFRYDISYCIRKDCDKQDCRRRRSNIPLGYVVSMADLKVPDGNGGCQYYLKENGKYDSGSLEL